MKGDFIKSTGDEKKTAELINTFQVKIKDGYIQ